jgi:hypothetical protein
VHGLGGADAEHDAQYFRIGDPLRQRWVEAGTSLLDEPKVEARRVGDRLDVVSRREVAIVAGDGRELPGIQTRDGLWEGVAEIGVLGAAAVAGPPTGVHRELHEVGEPPERHKTSTSIDSYGSASHRFAICACPSSGRDGSGLSRVQQRS